MLQPLQFILSIDHTPCVTCLSPCLAPRFHPNQGFYTAVPTAGHGGSPGPFPCGNGMPAGSASGGKERGSQQAAARAEGCRRAAGCSAPAPLPEFSSSRPLPGQRGRSGAEERTASGKLRRKRICKGRAKGVFSSQKFPNPSVLLPLLHPLGMLSRLSPFLLHQSRAFPPCQRLRAGADPSRPLRAFPDIQPPSHRAAGGMHPGHGAGEPSAPFGGRQGGAGRCNADVGTGERGELLPRSSQHRKSAIQE